MILELKNISKKFGGVQAISDTSFGIEKGEIFGLIGPNGAGKTTMFNIITASYMPTTGEVIFDGVNLKGIKPHKIVNLGISRTFQNIRLFSSMSVLENVLIGLNSATKYSFVEAILHFGRFRKSEKIAKAKAMEILSELGIEKFANEKATSLAYGIQRKVEIARALATNPKLLLLDEPAAGMNPRESDDLANLIFDLRKR
ncbi:MAG: ABC transporter ATP-binding protein, partial [Campylobacter sp.]|nr:ABC transporter ATP-binding protein [Campylobacter sp.]